MNSYEKAYIRYLIEIMNINIQNQKLELKIMISIY